MTVYTLLQSITSVLLPVYNELDAARNNAWLIVEHVMKKSRTQLLTQQNIILSEEHSCNLQNIVERIQQHMPVAYALGSVSFLGLDLFVERPILIPRPETEWWCSEVIALLKRKFAQRMPASFSVLDIATGSGCLALAIASQFDHITVIGVDNNPQALKLAQRNAERNALNNCTFLYSDLYEALPLDMTFDLIVTNPPYISAEKYQTLDPSVRLWEDPHALTTTDHGLFHIKRIIENASMFLKTSYSGGQLWCEIDDDQVTQVVNLLQTAGFKHTTCYNDLNNYPRVIQASLL